MDDYWKLISFIIRSKYRLKVIKSLENGEKTPSQISIITKIRINHVSNILKEFILKNLIVCLTPDERKGRIYILTDLGNNILHKIKTLNQM
ncbi:MAG: MarR family transcriptional regulator [Candidatus Helarchaeota archaeon]